MKVKIGQGWGEKLYVVYATAGGDGDEFECVIGVFSTQELAQEALREYQGKSFRSGHCCVIVDVVLDAPEVG